MIKPLLRSVCFIALGFCLITPVIAANQKDVSEVNALERGALRMRAFTPEQKKTYSKVAQKATVQAVEITSKTYRTDLQNAIVFHNLMNSVQKQINQLESHKLTVLDKEISAARVKDFDECNERWFAAYFKNPKVVWANLKEKTDALIDAYNQNTAIKTEKMANSEMAKVLAGFEDGGVDVSKEAQQKQRQKIDSTAKKYAQKIETETNAREDFNVQEAMEDTPEIDISFSVLNSFYPDQDNKDKWGAVRKSAQTHSLPLWEDQKYLYNERIWKPKYKEIVETCEKQKAIGGGMIVLPIKEPKVEDEIKYDYHFYDQVETAHRSFISMVVAQGCVLPPELAAAPESAPRPLPPVEEEIIVIEDENGTLNSIYPQIPMNPKVEKKSKAAEVVFEKNTLWDAYKAENFKDVYEKGEFSTYFELDDDPSIDKNTVVIKTLPPVDELDGNRLSRYLLYKRDLQNAEMAYNNLLDDAKELRDNIKDAVIEANGKKTEDGKDPETKIIDEADIEKYLNINYLDKNDLTKLMNFLKGEKNKLLTKVENKIGLGTATAAKKVASDKKKDCPLTQAEYGKLGDSSNKDYEKVMAKFKRCNEIESADVSAEDLNEQEKGKDKKQRSVEEDLAYLNALRLDENAEVLMTLEKALIIEDAIKEARANQALTELFDKDNNQNRLNELQGVVDEATGRVKVRGKNYSADDKKTCLGQTTKRLVDINKVKIK